MASEQFELKNGNLFVLAEAAGGVYNGSQLRLICDVADDVSVFLKITEDQRIGFMVPKDKLLELHGKLSKSGILLKHYRNHSILSPKACLGELCTKCEQDALGDAIEISPVLNEKFKDSFTALTIGMNGCGVACVASATDDIHIVGDSKGYNIFVGGRVSGEPKLAELVAEGIPKRKIGEAISIILETYSQNKQQGESVSDVVSRLGIVAFKEPLKKGGLSEETSVSPVNTVEEDIAAVPIEESLLEDSEKASLKEDTVEEDIAAVPIEEAPLEVVPTEESPIVDVPIEEAPLEVAGVEETPNEEIPIVEEISQENDSPKMETEEIILSDESNESAAAPVEETQATETTPTGEESMQEKSVVDELALSEASGGGEAPVKESSSKMRDLDIVDDTGESSPNASGENAVPDDLYAPEPIDHEMGEDGVPLEFDEDASSISNSSNKTSIQVRGAYVTVVLFDGSDFRIPFKTIDVGKVIEMQIEDETFIIENINGKLQVKYGDLEMHVPLSHGSVSIDEEDEVIVV